jgi:hypothetical protein
MQGMTFRPRLSRWQSRSFQIVSGAAGGLLIALITAVVMRYVR